MIFDRFFKPKSQHRDPIVREKALHTLAPDDPVLMQTLNEDANPAVRRAALARLTEFATLKEFAANDKDIGVREFAEARLRKLVSGSEAGGPDLDERLKLLPGLSQSSIEFIAQNGIEPEIRLAALNDVNAPDMLREMVIRDGSSSVRAKALEHIEDEEALASVVKQSRGKDKRVYKLAKQKLDVIRSARSSADRMLELVDALETLADEIGGSPNSPQFARIEQDWRNFSAEVDGELSGRYRRAHEKLMLRGEEKSHHRSARLELCHALEAALETLNGLDAQEKSKTTSSADIETQWNALETWDDIESSVLDTRFDDLRNKLRKRELELQRNAKRESSLKEVMSKSERLLEKKRDISEKEIGEIEGVWASLEKPEKTEQAMLWQNQFNASRDALRARILRQKDVHEKVLTDAETLIVSLEKSLEEGALSPAQQAWDQIRASLKEHAGLPRERKAKLQNRMNALQPKLHEMRGWRQFGTNTAREQLCEHAEGLIGSEESPPKLAEVIKQVRAEWKKLDSTERAASKALWNRFNTACEKAYEPCKLHFEAKGEERKANKEKRESLIAAVTALAESNTETPDYPDLDKQYRQYNDRWRSSGPIDRAAHRKLDKVFRRQMNSIEAILEPVRSAELARREALIVELQAALEGDDPAAAVDLAKRAQARWKPEVQCARRKEQGLWKQFRAACDAAFELRGAEVKAEDAERQANLVAKNALCVELKTLIAGEGATLLKSRAQFQALQLRWDEVGQVPKGAVNALLKRYNELQQQYETAVDDAQIAQENSKLDVLIRRGEICMLAEALLQADVDESGISVVKESWQALPESDSRDVQAVTARFQTVLDALEGSAVDRDAIKDTLGSMLKTKQEQCLQIEIACGVESPPEYAQARLEFQVGRLSQSMATRDMRNDNGNGALKNLLLEWIADGCLPANEANALQSRVANARASSSI